jgi:hypothetical protein
MRLVKLIFPFVIGIVPMVGGCGTYVPEIQENPWSSDGSLLLVNAIVDSVQCEIQNAITYVINADYENSRLMDRPPGLDWLRTWGVQTQLTLTVDEKSIVSPTGVQSPIGIFFLGLGASLSSQATRINTLTFYRLVPEVYGAGTYCRPEDIPHPLGSLLIQSDLKLREWLTSILVLSVAPIRHISPIVPFARSPESGHNGFSHEVTFEVVTSGNISPIWKLVHATINQGGPLFSASRDRKHDFIITFGPNDPDTKSLKQPAAGTFLASQIGLANRTQLIGTVPTP